MWYNFSKNIINENNDGKRIYEGANNKKYKGALESLRDDEFIWGTVFINGELIELDNSNKSQYILEIEELIKKLGKEIL